MLEHAQPYHSPYGPESNILFWLHELARTDRHRSLHVGLGRIGQHRVQIGVPAGITAEFDQSAQPFAFIDDDLVIARFTLSHPLDCSEIFLNPDVGIDPEIKGWDGYRINGAKVPLQERMTMTEVFSRNHLENMAFHAGEAPPGGFRTLDSDEAG